MTTYEKNQNVTTDVATGEDRAVTIFDREGGLSATVTLHLSDGNTQGQIVDVAGALTEQEQTDLAAIIAKLEVAAATAAGFAPQ